MLLLEVETVKNPIERGSQDNQKLSQNSPITVSGKPRIDCWMISTLVLLVVLLLGGLYILRAKTQTVNNQKAASTSAPTVFLPAKSNNKELSEWYSVEYPNNFFVAFKSYNEFGVAEKRWEGDTSHIPEAVIRVYNNLIPSGMSLRDWLNGVGNPTPPVGNQGVPKSCKEFLDRIRQELKYGDLFNDQYLKGSDCLYFGVSDIKDKTIVGLPAVEFTTQNVSSGATHTIFVYKSQSGVNLLFDISYTATGQSDETDRTVEAYETYLNTFELREK